MPRVTTSRRLAGAAQAIVFLALPFVSVGGESALRLDLPSARLHALGASFSLGEAFVVLAAILVLLGGFLLVTLLWGRVWCGWSCPQTVLGDLTAWAAPPRGRRADRWRRPLGLAAAAMVSTVFSAAALLYFVRPAEFFSRLAAGALGPALSGWWAALAVLLFADLVLVRQTFCATVCPYAKLQGVLFDRSTLVVAYDARRAQDCVDCGACVRVCPTGIDIRDGLQVECLACGACIDACRPIMAKLRRAPHLVGWAWGEPGGRPRPLRPAAVALAVFTLGWGGALGATVATRGAVSVSAQSASLFTPRRAADGRALDAYDLELENHGRAPVTVTLGAAAAVPGAGIEVRPDRVDLGPGERRRVRVLAAVRGLPPGRSRAALTLEVRDGARVLERRSVDLSVAVPEAR